MPYITLSQKKQAEISEQETVEDLRQHGKRKKRRLRKGVRRRKREEAGRKGASGEEGRESDRKGEVCVEERKGQ